MHTLRFLVAATAYDISRLLHDMQIVTSPPVREAKYCDDGVCLSVCEHISGTTCPIFTNFMHVAYVRGSVLLWRRCDTLCTSGFIDDVIFAHNREQKVCRKLY